jgi:hypothetical protein
MSRTVSKSEHLLGEPSRYGGGWRCHHGQGFRCEGFWLGAEHAMNEIGAVGVGQRNVPPGLFSLLLADTQRLRAGLTNVAPSGLERP